MKLPPLLVTTPFTYRHQKRDQKQNKEGKKVRKKIEARRINNKIKIEVGPSPTCFIFLIPHFFHTSFALWVLRALWDPTPQKMITKKSIQNNLQNFFIKQKNAILVVNPIQLQQKQNLQK